MQVATVVSESPSAEHWRRVSPLQRNAFGTHSVEMHRAASGPVLPGARAQLPEPFTTQVVVSNPVPSALHVCTDVPSMLHWVLPGEQVASTQAPLEQAWAQLVIPTCPVPAALHCRISSPLQLTAPGVQVCVWQNATDALPERPFVVHVAEAAGPQLVVVTPEPSVLQVESWPSAVQVVAPGRQTAAMHAAVVASQPSGQIETGLYWVPSALQVVTPLPEQREVPGVQICWMQAPDWQPAAQDVSCTRSRPSAAQTTTDEPSQVFAPGVQMVLPGVQILFVQTRPKAQSVVCVQAAPPSLTAGTLLQPASPAARSSGISRSADRARPSRSPPEHGRSGSLLDAPTVKGVTRASPSR